MRGGEDKTNTETQNRTFLKKHYFTQERIKISMYTRKYLSKRFWILLLSILIAFICNAVISPMPNIDAAQASNNPLVLVAIDKTQSSSCTETFKANIGTPQFSTQHISCPLGTIMSNITIRRSEAVAQNEPYVVLPLHSSPILWQQTQRQIQILDKSREAILQAKGNKYMHPATGCGQSGSASTRWNLDGGVLNAIISFYKSTDCTTAYFDDSQLNTTVSMNDDSFWSRDYYAGYEYDVPSCPNIKTIGHRFHIVSTSAPVGYYYENDVWSGYPFCAAWTYSLDNIGPIN